jgi:hypothetical protein
MPIHWDEGIIDAEKPILVIQCAAERYLMFPPPAK